jgi:LmbE family N-acetylglucosaminyl deacetylase
VKFNQPAADLFIPDEIELSAAIGRATHLGIGAHQDDLEFMALHGILECFQRDDRYFGGIICTDGGGSSRTGPYSGFSDEQMKAARVEEQKLAARIGQYGFMAQLGHSSTSVKDPECREALVEDLVQLLRAACPEIVYTHHPFDKHATHVGVFRAVVEAIRMLPPALRPARLHGCEVWRGLDWLPDELKLIHDVSAHPDLAISLNSVFKSQIAGGKRYDLAVEGRRLANATFLEPHATDAAGRVNYAIDLTVLTHSDGPTVEAFVGQVLDAFGDAIRKGI